MKKILVILFLILSAPVFAKNIDYTTYCPKEPYSVGNSFTRAVSNVTGTNFLFTKIAESSIERALKDELDSRFNVEIYPYGSISLLNGKFKKITVESRHITSDDIYITEFKMSSLCDYNDVYTKGDDLYFEENFVMGFEGKITNSDLENIILNNMSKIQKMNLSVLGVSLFNVSNPIAQIQGDKIKLSITVEYSNLLRTTVKNLEMQAGLKVVDGTVQLTNLTYNQNTGINTKLLTPVLNLINPFNSKIKIDDDTMLYSNITNLNFVNNEIIFKGTGYIPKNR